MTERTHAGGSGRAAGGPDPRPVAGGADPVEVSALGYALLCALHRGPLTGYDLVRRMRRPIGYYWTARQSQIYPELARLSAAGLIEHEAESGPGPRQRKTHRLTSAGHDALAQWLVGPAAARAPRDQTILRTYALSVADPARMRAYYLAEATERQSRLDEFQTQHDRLLADGADDPDHPDFGAYATLRLAVTATPVRIAWCRWLADRLAERAHRRGRPVGPPTDGTGRAAAQPSDPASSPPSETSSPPSETSTVDEAE